MGKPRTLTIEVRVIFMLARSDAKPVDTSRSFETAKSKPTDVLKRVLNPHLVYGPAVIEHALLVAGSSTRNDICLI